MAITDLLTPVTASASARPATDTLAAPGYTHGATSATLSAGTNWADGVIYFTIYTTTTIGSTVVKDPTTQTDWKATKSGTSLTNMTLTGGSATQDYTTGAIVELTPTSRYAYDLYQWGTAHANLDGTLKTAAIQTAIGASNTTAGWTAVGFVPLYASNNGNKEFTCTVSTNLTSTLSTGMKLKLDRSVAPPTQAMAFTAASSQYATKASPTGITFTSAYTCEAWVYLNSYTGATAVIVSRYDGTTQGWGLRVNTSGQLETFYGTAAAFTINATYQSLPLNRWVHVASAVTSLASKTFVTYINGVSVPNSNSNTGATALTQGGPLQVGANNSVNFFNGYISEARVWSAAQSQAQIQANMAISLTGSETNLVALFQGNGNFNDLTTNANNLTATGGAIATQAANPYSATEYFSLISISYNGGSGLSTLTLDGGTNNSLPNQVLANFQYSTQQSPFGFPANLKQYVRTVILGSNYTTATQSSATAGTLSGGTLTVTIPTNASSLKLTGFSGAISNTGGSINILEIWDGTPGTGTKLVQANEGGAAGVSQSVSATTPPLTLASGSHTFNLCGYTTGNTVTFTASTTQPTYLLMECSL